MNEVPRHPRTSSTRTGVVDRTTPTTRPSSPEGPGSLARTWLLPRGRITHPTSDRGLALSENEKLRLRQPLGPWAPR